jgi:hypothetical protein
MGCAAEIIALDDVRASQQRHALRQQLHERFDQWLDEVEAQLSEAEPTLAQVSETIWSLRQGLTASVAQTMIEQSHQDEVAQWCFGDPYMQVRKIFRPLLARV